MKLDDLLLKRAAAARDKAAILQVFSWYFSSLLPLNPSRWEIFQSVYIDPCEIRLEMPDGSFSYTKGKFYIGGWDSDFQIVYHRNFYRDYI